MSATEMNPAIGGDAVTDLGDNFNQLNIDRDNSIPKTEEEYAQSQLTLRAIVSSKEAGVIIGKAGKNVADLRDETGVKAGVSKVVQGVHDRVLTVSGPLQGISKAYAIVAKGLLEGAPAMGMGGVVQNGTHRKPISVINQVVTNHEQSNPSTHLAQSNGHNHRSSRPQDQDDSRRIWRTHGRPERDASSINGAHSRSTRHTRGH